MSLFFILLCIIPGFNVLNAETVEKIPFGDMDLWIIRYITESKVLGKKNKNVYAIGSAGTVNGATAYIPADGNPWATSNVLANICGVVKTSNAVSPGNRDTGGSTVCLSSRS